MDVIRAIAIWFFGLVLSIVGLGVACFFIRDILMLFGFWLGLLVLLPIIAIVVGGLCWIYIKYD